MQSQPKCKCKVHNECNNTGLSLSTSAEETRIMPKGASKMSSRGPLRICLGKFQQVNSEATATSALESFYIRQSDGQFGDAD